MTPEERDGSVWLGGYDIGPLLEDARRKAVADNNFLWWSALCMVDNVPPTPEAVREWVIAERALAVREACEITEQDRADRREIAESLRVLREHMGGRQ